LLLWLIREGHTWVT
jgi:hypothetical protein